MDQIYRDQHQDYEVYTTILSPHVGRAKSRRRATDSDQVESKATPSLIRRSSVPVVRSAVCGCTSGHNTPKLLRRHSLLKTPVCTASSSPSLLLRVLDKSRRKSCPFLQEEQGGAERSAHDGAGQEEQRGLPTMEQNRRSREEQNEQSQRCRVEDE